MKCANVLFERTNNAAVNYPIVSQRGFKTRDSVTATGGVEA